MPHSEGFLVEDRRAVGGTNTIGVGTSSVLVCKLEGGEGLYRVQWQSFTSTNDDTRIIPRVKVSWLTSAGNQADPWVLEADAYEGVVYVAGVQASIVATFTEGVAPPPGYRCEVSGSIARVWAEGPSYATHTTYVAKVASGTSLLVSPLPRFARGFQLRSGTVSPDYAIRPVTRSGASVGYARTAGTADRQAGTVYADDPVFRLLPGQRAVFVQNPRAVIDIDDALLIFYLGFGTNGTPNLATGPT